MKSPVFYRNIYARDHLELFLVSAVSSLLLVRFYLHLTGYPQIGGETFHIAHMLWGGLFMLVAIVMLVSLLGRQIQRRAAFVGGVGFGIFIDELGKFITRDNDYFFRPTIGIIYAIFISLYLIFNFLGRTSKLSSVEYQLNALEHFEEAVLQDLDNQEKYQIRKLLAKANQKSAITKELNKLLQRLDTVPDPRPSRFKSFLRKLDQKYQHFWLQRSSSRLVAAVFIVEALLFLSLVFGGIINNAESLQTLLQGYTDYGRELLIGQLLSTFLAAGYALYGVVQLRRSRLLAFELFRRATLVNLFLTEFFIFSRIQFGAMPSFVLNLVLLVGLHYAISHERRQAALR